MAGGRVRDGEPSPRPAAAAQPGEVDPVIALVSLVGTTVRAWDPRDASVDAVIERIVRQIQAVAGVYGAYLRDIAGDRADLPRSSPRERPPGDHEELSWP